MTTAKTVIPKPGLFLALKLLSNEKDVSGCDGSKLPGSNKRSTCSSNYEQSMLLQTGCIHTNTMLNPEMIAKMAEKLQKSIPKSVMTFGEDVEKKIRQGLQFQLSRLDLISREEFDVQTQVLLRTRENLTLLEQRVQKLEAKLSEKKDI